MEYEEIVELIATSFENRLEDAQENDEFISHCLHKREAMILNGIWLFDFDDVTYYKKEDMLVLSRESVPMASIRTKDVLYLEQVGNQYNSSGTSDLYDRYLETGSGSYEVNNQEDVPIESNRTEDVPIESNRTEDVPIESNRTEDVPIESNRTEDVSNLEQVRNQYSSGIFDLYGKYLETESVSYEVNESAESFSNIDDVLVRISDCFDKDVNIDNEDFLIKDMNLAEIININNIYFFDLDYLLFDKLTNEIYLTSYYQVMVNIPIGVIDEIRYVENILSKIQGFYITLYPLVLDAIKNENETTVQTVLI